MALVCLAKEEAGLSELCLVSLALKDIVVVDFRRDGGTAVLSCSSLKRLPWSGRLPSQCPHHCPLEAVGMHPRQPAPSRLQLLSVRMPCSSLTPLPSRPHAVPPAFSRRTWNRNGVPAKSSTHPVACACTNAAFFNSMAL